MTKVIVKTSSLPSRKFYFLDYFFIFLSSVEKNIIQDEVFSAFKILKQEYRLGESKYKTLHQQGRYRYTFNKVMDECKEYGLLIEKEDHTIHLTEEGKRLLLQHRTEGIRPFNLSIFRFMENAHKAFRTLVEFLYKANPKGSGVLVFPHYSPLKLHFDTKNIRTTKDMTRYTESLVKKLQGDIKRYLKRNVNLTQKNQELLNKITRDGLLPKSSSGRFAPKEYNKITKRIRDFWITYFLQELYKCPYSMTSFDSWGYRARQIGVIQATESYPFINGKLVYPTSVVLDAVHSDDFSEIYHYSDGKRLFVHKPTLGDEEESPYKNKFVDTLVKGYFDLKRQVRYNFINLASLREIVCFRLKISMHTFEETLNEIYRLNLSGQLKIRISLEVDKLPEETSAMYVKHEPVMVDGSYRNIIAIDVSKGGPK
jgi:ribosomal protein S19E (S16A)